MRITGDPVKAIQPRPQNESSHLAGDVALLAVIIFTFLIVSCSRAQTPPAQTGPQFTIQRLAPSVFMGEADPLPEVSVDDAQTFPLNFLATTGQDGEAVIKGEIEGASCSIFIFFNTRLERSACNRAASEGNTTCLEEGSAVFENCHNHLVQTASGEVKLLGTWASVTYLPDQQLTLLAVTEGETSVQPVLDDMTQTMGSPVAVGAGEYFYSAPDQELNPVAGVPPRQAVPLSNFGPVLAQYPQAFNWISMAMDRSKEYGVDPAQFEPTPTQIPTSTETPEPIYTLSPTPPPTVTSTPTITPSPTISAPNVLVIPRPVQADLTKIDGYCVEPAYGLAYLYRYKLGGDDVASGYLMQDENWLYICGTNTSGSPRADTLSVFLDPQGDGDRYPFANQGDYQLRLNVSTGKIEILVGNGDGRYVTSDEHQRDWVSAATLSESQQILFEYAINLRGFAIGGCGQSFGLALMHNDFLNDKSSYGWPDGVIANRPNTWQSAVLEQPNCPDQPQGQIAFTCQITQESDQQQICLVNADGSGYRMLTDETDFSYGFPSFAPDGKSLVYVSNRTGTYEIYDLDMEHSLETQLTDSLGDLAAPAISPHGDRIVFTNRTDYSGKPYVGNGVWIMERSGENPHRLVGLPWGYAWDPVWSPDGERILFASNRDGDVHLYTVDAEGGTPVRLNRLDNLRGRSDWSSMGKIATYAGDTWTREIVIMNADGTDVHTITDGGNNLAPSFSPDGSWIAFTSYRDHYEDEQGCEIYIMRTDGSDIRRLTDNDYCDYQPRWGPSIKNEFDH